MLYTIRFLIYFNIPAASRDLPVNPYRVDVDVRFTVQATNIANDDTKYYQLGSIKIPARTTSWYPLSWYFSFKRVFETQFSMVLSIIDVVNREI